MKNTKEGFLLVLKLRLIICLWWRETTDSANIHP